MKSIESVDRLYTWACSAFSLPEKYNNHRRGAYKTFGGGLSFGNGRTEPGPFAMTQHNARVFQAVLDCPEMQQVARYCDCTPVSSLPELYISPFL